MHFKAELSMHHGTTELNMLNGRAFLNARGKQREEEGFQLIASMEM